MMALSPMLSCPWPSGSLELDEEVQLMHQMGPDTNNDLSY